MVKVRVEGEPEREGMGRTVAMLVVMFRREMM